MSETPSERAPIDLLVRTPYIRVLTYPKISLRSARSRIRQLRALKVTELVFRGRAKIGRLGILGLGTVGVVVSAVSDGQEFALKIRRMDANRPDMSEEARVTALVNRVGVGPTIDSHSKDFILMKMLDFVELDPWLRGLSGKGTRETTKGILHSIFNQCRLLDVMGVDHGQLSNLRKHVVIAEGRPWIVDFESAGTSRRPKNLTTAAQYLLVGGRISPLVRRLIGFRDVEDLLALLARYKSDTSDFTYSKILETLRL